MKVSVVTPVFNAVETIFDCIQSVSGQQQVDIEHIVIDGGSTDGTLDIVRREGVTFVSEKDAGVYDAFNKGVALADGDVIHILNADDMYAEDSVVEQVVAEMVANELDLCHGYTNQINANAEVVKKIGGPVTRRDLLAKMRVAHPATFVTRAVYDEFGAYSVGFRIAADHEFLLRVWDKVRIGFIPVIVTNMRLGGASTSNVRQSYRESMAASVMHGAHPLVALSRYYLELVKSVVPGVQPRIS